MSLAATLAVALLAAAPEAPTPKPPAPTTEAPRAAAEGMPEPLRQLLDRELPPLPKARFEIARDPGKLAAEVEAKGAVEVGRDGETDTLVVPLGTEQAIRCVVARVRTDGASPVTSMLQRMKEGSKVMSVRPVEVTAVAGSPALFVEAVYAVEGKDGKKALGQLKQAVVPHPDRSLMCLHDEPGYAKTFRRVVKGLAASLAAAAPDVRVQARFAEVIALRVKGAPVGFAEQTVAADPGGGSTLRLFTSVLVPRSPGEVLAQDEVVVQQLDPSGRILSSTIAQATGGEVETNLTLERGEDGKTYRYRGTLKGKQLEGSFATRDGLASDLLAARSMRKLLSGGSKALRLQRYSADANPTGPLEAVYRKDAGARRVTLEVAGSKSKIGLDANGWPALVEMPLGATTMVFERIWSRGQP